MSTYRNYCQNQAVECTRRARLAASPEVADRHRKLGQEWLKLAEKERAKSRLRATPSLITNEAVQEVPATRVSWRRILKLSDHRRLVAAA
jgi:hypothetical protein